jgi:hypothetical protein
VLAGKKITLSNIDSKIQASVNDKLYLYDPSGGEVASADFVGDNFISASSSAPLAIKNNQATNVHVVAAQSVPVKNQTPQNLATLQTASVAESINSAPLASSSKGFWAQVIGFFHF